MFCMSCGKQQLDGAKFCTNCGAPLAAPGQAAAPVSASPAPATAPAPGVPTQPAGDKKPGHGKTIGVVIACVAIIAAAAIAIYFILFSGKAENDAQVAVTPATTEAATTEAATTDGAPATTTAVPATTSAAASEDSPVVPGETRADGDVTYTAPYYGFQFRLPGSFSITSDSSNGVIYTDEASQISVSAYADASSGQTPDRILSGYESNFDLEYKAKGDNWCVASWKSDGHEYYDKVYVTDGYEYSFDFKYPASSAQAGSDLIEAYIQYFKPGTE